MEVHDRIEVVQGDITKEHVDVIVNAANRSLRGEGGVDGAIHRAAGPGLLEECKTLGGCETGDAKMTSGYDLPAKFVIHAVGPVWKDGRSGEPELLASCYRRSLDLAAEKQLASIAFPAISCGAYGFPVAKAARIAVKEVYGFLSDHRRPERVRLVCFEDETYREYEAALRRGEEAE